MNRYGLFWLLLTATVVHVSAARSAAGEVVVETQFDDVAAYPPLRLIDARSWHAGRPPDEAETDPLIDDEPSFESDDPWTSSDPAEFQILPTGLLYKSYLAGEKEPRFQAVWLSEKSRGLVWETQLGGRVGLLRYGSRSPINPDGWQLDLEGGAQARVDPQQHSDLEAVDYRIGLLSTWRVGPNAFKAGFYHLSSHLGDEFLIRNPGFTRLNYVRDSAIVGWMHDLSADLSVYGELAYAFNHEDGAKPLELQYGFQFAPLDAFDLRGAPFVAINGHTREDLDWITGFNTVAGWLWRGEDTNHTFRVGMQYYTGPAIQYSFVGRHETLLGGGVWFDY